MCVIGRVIRTRNVSITKPIVAYRAWKISNTPDLFKSIYQDDWWSPNDPQCASAPPSHNGDTGFWAFKCLLRAKREYRRADRVFGKVVLWGKVFEHQFGYRSEFAVMVPRAENRAKKKRGRAR